MLGFTSQVTVRKGKESDANNLADVFRQSWLNAYTGIIPSLYLESMISRRSASWWKRAISCGEGILVSDIAGTPAGYATWGNARGLNRHKGEIYELYVLPSHQGLGVGEHLFEGCRARLDERNLNGLVVWALSDNTPAIDFYWRRGGRPTRRSYDTFGERRLEKIGFEWN